MSPKKLTVEEFVLQAIRTLRTPPHHGIHTVYSGFNEGFRAYFPNLDPVKEVVKLAKAGVIGCKPSRGGAKIWDAKELAERKAGEKTKISANARKVLEKMGLKN